MLPLLTALKQAQALKEGFGLWSDGSSQSMSNLSQRGGLQPWGLRSLLSNTRSNSNNSSRNRHSASTRNRRRNSNRDSNSNDSNDNLHEGLVILVR